jgi:methyl-accepting chemotaxis protein
MGLGNLRVKIKLILGFAIPVVLFTAFSLWLQWAMTDVSARLRHIENESASYALLAKDLEKAVTQVQQFLSDISATRAQDGLDDGFAEAQNYHDVFVKGIAKFIEFDTASGNTERADKARKLQEEFEKYYQTGVKMAHGYIDGGPALGNKMMGDFDQTSLELQNDLKPFVEAQLEEMKSSVDAVKHEVAQARSAGLVTGLGVIILTIIIANVTILSIIRPLGLMQKTISDVEKNSDFTRQINLGSSDELGSTARAFDQLMRRLREIIQQIRNSVEGIADASQTLTRSTNKVTEGSIQQMEASTTAASSIEQISVTMGEVASHARESENLSDVSRQETREALTITRQSMEGMHRTAQSIKASGENVERLSKSSEQINGIITVIKEIADQTNLLALNAAIEAARAGEQGRGFAVVADEVRKLAERTARSTGEIGDLISAIQAEIDQTVDTMKSADQEVSTSVEIAGRASEALEKIGERGDKINERMKEISNAVHESDIAIQEIARQAEKIAQMTEGNSTAAGESGNTAGHLDELASKLRQAVESYRI